MTKVFNQREEKPKRRLLRQFHPETEAVVWEHLRGSRLADAKFRRQFSVEQFVLDLYCPEVQLAIGVDGASHEGGGGRGL